MASARERLDRIWPRRGILATEAGRRVVSDVVILTLLAFVFAVVVVAAALFIGISVRLAAAERRALRRHRDGGRRCSA